jgi:hypothetical protein
VVDGVLTKRFTARRPIMTTDLTPEAAGAVP